MMQNPVQLPSLSATTAISYARKVLHPYKCQWKGCDALLNCWENLRKHYHLHCKGTKSVQVHPTCEIYPCPLENHRALSLEGIMVHIEKTHLSREHLPCPLDECEDTELTEHFEAHFKLNHEEFLHKTSPLLQYSLMAFPFQPAPHTRPPISFPREAVPMHAMLSSVLTISPWSTWAPTYIEMQERFTSWSGFKFAEHFEKNEEKDMMALDLGFEPLRRPPRLSDLPGTLPWPAFSIPAQKFTPKHFTRVSQPFSLSAPEPVSRAQTILYDAFEQWLDSRAQTS